MIFSIWSWKTPTVVSAQRFHSRWRDRRRSAPSALLLPPWATKKDSISRSPGLPTKNGAQVTLEGLQDDTLDLHDRLPQELLAGITQQLSLCHHLHLVPTWQETVSPTHTRKHRRCSLMDDNTHTNTHRVVSWGVFGIMLKLFFTPHSSHFN